MELKRTVLVFVFNRELNPNHLLMIWKKRGQGMGKWNVPGGKCLLNESEENAAIRETLEETGLQVKSLTKSGTLEFYFPEQNSWDNHCSVFQTSDFSGNLLTETEECKTSWIPLNEIPWNDMWDSDRLWVPLLLQEKNFHRIYSFDGDDKLIKEKIIL